MSAFADAARDMHDDETFAVDAIYTPPGPSPDPLECRVIMSERESAEGLGVVRETTGTVLLAEIADPREGGTLTVGDATWTVRAVMRDVEHVTATLILRG